MDLTSDIRHGEETACTDSFCIPKIENAMQNVKKNQPDDGACCNFSILFPF